MEKLKLNIQLFASSGDFGEIPFYDIPYTWYHLVWSATQNITGNYSDVTATLYFSERSGYDNGYFHKKIVIGGTTYNNTGEWISPGGTSVSVATKRIYHTNEGYGSTTIYACDGNLGGTAYLNTINRYATFTKYDRYPGLDRISVNWSADVAVDFIQYRLNGGSWVNTSGDWFEIPNLTPNTYYTVQIQVRRADSGLWTQSGTFGVTTIDQVKVTSSQNFDDTQNPVVYFTNPSDKPVTARIEGTGGITIQRLNVSNPYTFVLTEEERQVLRYMTPNSNTAGVRFTLANVVDNAEKFWSYQDRVLTIINANPIFSNFVYEDTNSVTIALTGSNQKIIKGYSNVKATVSVANKAIPLKGSTMSKYRFVVGSKQIDANYSSTNDVTMNLNGIDNNIFNVYAIDSRNNSTVKQLSPSTYIEYFNPYFSAPLPIAERTDGIGTQTTLTFSGLFFNSSFGTVTNDIEVIYKYKKTSDSSYTTGTTILTITKNGNQFSFTGLIAGDLGANGFDANYSYNLQIVATDEITSITYDLIIGTGTPNIAVHSDGVSINGPYNPTNGGDFQIAGNNIWKLIFPIGTGFIDYTNTDYSNRFGLTWVKTCIGKTPVGMDVSQTEFNIIGKTGGAKTHVLDITQIPSHNHPVVTSIYGYLTNFNNIDSNYGVQNGGAYRDRVAGFTSNANTNALYTSVAGGGLAHNNLSPYQVVNFWKRTA